MKMSLIGGGGVRTPYFVESLAKYAEALGVTQLTLMDSDEEKLTTYGALAKWMAEQTGARVNIELTANPIEAVRDAAYVVTTLRVGQDQARVLDETIALKHGVLGQETTGAGGCMYALRTIPAMLQYMQWVREYARPDAMVFNFTNPAGLVTQAMVDAGYDRIVGICDRHEDRAVESAEAERHVLLCAGVRPQPSVLVRPGIAPWGGYPAAAPAPGQLCAEFSRFQLL